VGKRLAALLAVPASEWCGDRMLERRGKPVTDRNDDRLRVRRPVPHPPYRRRARLRQRTSPGASPS